MCVGKGVQYNAHTAVYCNNHSADMLLGNLVLFAYTFMDNTGVIIS